MRKVSSCRMHLYMLMHACMLFITPIARCAFICSHALCCALIISHRFSRTSRDARVWWSACARVFTIYATLWAHALCVYYACVQYICCVMLTRVMNVRASSSAAAAAAAREPHSHMHVPPHSCVIDTNSDWRFVCCCVALVQHTILFHPS